MSESAAQIVFVRSARAAARADAAGAALEEMLRSIIEQLDVESAVIVTGASPGGGLRIAAAAGLGDAATRGLSAAIASPSHPIARTMVAGEPKFDVAPTAPGGPALRSHVPLIVRRGGAEVVLGVLALAHGRATEPGARSLIEACADLAAVTIESHRAP